MLRITMDGGEGGIRTHGTVAGTTVFKTVSFNHSDTSPTPEDYSILENTVCNTVFMLYC